METVVAAIITGVSGVVSSLIGAWATLNRVNTKPPEETTPTQKPQESSNYTRERREVLLSTQVLFSLIVGGIICAVSAVLVMRHIQDKNQLKFAPDFSGWSLSSAASNAEVATNVEEKPAVPTSLPYYELKSNNTIPAVKVPLIVNLTNINWYLHYVSNLKQDFSYSFVALGCCPPGKSFFGNNGFLIILHSEEEDIIELSLKDKFNNERKPLLQTKKDWAGYIVYFREFPGVEMNNIVYFHLAHVAHNTNKTKNAFRIALIKVF